MEAASKLEVGISPERRNLGACQQGRGQALHSAELAGEETVIGQLGEGNGLEGEGLEGSGEAVHGLVSRGG